MKGALACYVEAVRALQDAGVRLKGDVLVAAVPARSRRRSRATLRAPSTAATRPARATSSAHGGVADMCILGEPTENKLVLAHFGTLWLRLSTSRAVHPHGVLEGRLEENSIVRMRAVLDRRARVAARRGRRR